MQKPPLYRGCHGNRTLRNLHYCNAPSKAERILLVRHAHLPSYGHMVLIIMGKTHKAAAHKTHRSMVPFIYTDTCGFPVGTLDVGQIYLRRTACSIFLRRRCNDNNENLV